MTMAAPLSAAQLAQFERAGVVTVDTALTPEQVSHQPPQPPQPRLQVTERAAID